jgi:methylated-DNA-[protein]-cysteine S-methyltransferase
MGSITFDTSIGRIRLVATAKGISKVQDVRGRERAPMGKATPMLRRAKKEFLEYLDGRRRRFTVKVDLSSGTRFQQRVWRQIARIPYGKVITYGELARRAGCPDGARAAGQATGSNPVGIIVPCHRVVAANKKIGGFGPGLPLKRRLLRLEGVKGIEG